MLDNDDNRATHTNASSLDTFRKNLLVFISTISLSSGLVLGAAGLAESETSKKSSEIISDFKSNFIGLVKDLKVDFDDISPNDKMAYGSAGIGIGLLALAFKLRRQNP